MDTIIAGREGLKQAAELIKSGDVVAFPTETVYGLGADAYNVSAVKKIFTAKGRPQDNPLIVHIASPEDVYKVAKEIPSVVISLFNAFSPGPLTLVLKKRDDLNDVTTGGLNTVGVRIPDNELARELIRLSGRVLAAPSANASGRISPTEARFVYDDLKGKIPMILDGGPCEVGIESTVLDLTKKIPVILRPGAITIDMLSIYLDEVVNHKGEVITAEAPGMKYKHYAPICPCVAAKTVESAIREYDSRKLENPVIIGTDEFCVAIKNRNFLSLGKNTKECLRNLVKALRIAESIYGYIIIQSFADIQELSSLQNRLVKSTGGVLV